MTDSDTPKHKTGKPAGDAVTLGSVIHQARESAGLPLRELAGLVGLHYSVLSRIEAGAVARPSPEVVQNIAEVLKLDAGELLAFLGIKATLPEPKVFFRRAYGMSDSEAAEAEAIIANLRAHQHGQQANDNHQAEKGGEL